MMSAVEELIRERRDQLGKHGYTPRHDDSVNSEGQLVDAAIAYLSHNFAANSNRWPWNPEMFKPGSRMRNLVKAGALILAEIDRLERDALRTPYERSLFEHIRSLESRLQSAIHNRDYYADERKKEQNKRLQAEQTLRVAAGFISTMGQHRNRHPDEVLKWLHDQAHNNIDQADTSRG